jgi:hypothetical protein
MTERLFNDKMDYPTFGAFCNWIMNSTVPIDKATGKKIVAKVGQYVPGSLNDTVLNRDGVKFPYAMSCLADTNDAGLSSCPTWTGT